MNIRKTFESQKTISKGTIFLIILASGVIAATIYFWFLQPANFISKQRIAIALGLWLIFTAGLYVTLSGFKSKLHTIQNNEYFAASMFSMILALLVGFLVIGVENVPYNLFLLPKHIVEIETANLDEDAVVELFYFHTGLGDISFSALTQKGNWQRTETSLISYGREISTLQYEGWLFGETFLIFQAHPQGGQINVYWDGQLDPVKLYAPYPTEIRVDGRISATPISKLSVTLLTCLTTWMLLFSFAILFTKPTGILHDATSLDTWFEETTARFQKPVYIISILSTLATLMLFFTSSINKDQEAYNLPNRANDYPNIIIIVVDALTSEDMSLFDYDISTTPNLENVTQTWSKYANAQTPSTCSIGVYPALITGHYCYTLRPYSDYGSRIRTSDNWVDLFQILDNLGYETWWSGYLSPGFYHTGAGLDNAFAVRFGTSLINSWFQIRGVKNKWSFPYIPISFKIMDYLAYANQDGDLLDATMNLFKQNAFNDPFFLYVHYDGVHGVPYPSGPYLGSILPIAEGLLDRSGQSIVLGEYKPNQQFIADKQRLRYDEAIRYQDVRLKDLIDTIKEADLYDSSMIIITADHGQVFDNGFTTHCTPLVSYAETHVPLLIKYPFQEHGEMIHSLVSTIDITPTIMDILGIPYKPDWFDGISLLEIDESQQTKRSVYTRTSTESNLYLVVTQDQYKITLRADEFFLFDYKNDPSEKENLIPILGDDHEIVQNLMQALEQYLAKIEQYQK